MGANAKRAYICDRCNTVHGDYFDAERCCQPEVHQDWQCEICEEVYSKQSVALDCCADSERAELTQLRERAGQLERAGQRRLIP